MLIIATRAVDRACA